MLATEAADDAVREYLLFRGFTDTLRSFEQECRDSTRFLFKAGALVQHLMTLVGTSEYQDLKRFWRQMEQGIFTKLDTHFQERAAKYHDQVLRIFLVTAKQRHAISQLNEALSDLAAGGAPGWQEWFALPHIRQPEEHQVFRTYLFRSTTDGIKHGLYNFLSRALASIRPLPILLQTTTTTTATGADTASTSAKHGDRASSSSQEKELAHLKERVRELEDENKALRQAAEASGSQTADTRTDAQQVPPSSSPDIASTTASATAPTATVPVAAGAAAPNTEPSPLRQQQGQPSTPSQRSSRPPSATTDPGQSPLTRTPSKRRGLLPEPFISVGQEHFSGHTGRVIACRLSPNSSRVLSADDKGAIILWDRTTVEAMSTWHVADLQTIVWPTGSDSLFYAVTSEVVLQFSIADIDAPLHTWSPPQRHRLSAVCACPRSQHLVVATASQDEPYVCILQTSPFISKVEDVSLPPSLRDPISVTVSADESLLAVGTAAARVVAIDLVHPYRLRSDVTVGEQSSDNAPSIIDLLFSPDQAYLFVQTDSGVVYQWRGAELCRRIVFTGCVQAPAAVSFALHDSHLALGGELTKHAVAAISRRGIRATGQTAVVVLPLTQQETSSATGETEATGAGKQPQQQQQQGKGDSAPSETVDMVDAVVMAVPGQAAPVSCLAWQGDYLCAGDASGSISISTLVSM